jgi:hypothetical protein
LYVSYGLTKTIHHAVAPFFFFFAGISVRRPLRLITLKTLALDVLLIGVSGGLIALSVFAKSRTLLTVGILSACSRFWAISRMSISKILSAGRLP